MSRHLLAETTTFGDGTIEHVPSLVGDLDARRVLLVCGRTSFDASGAARIVPALEAVAEVERFSDFRPNTDAQDLAVAVEVVQRRQPDLVVGIGGGSAMDLAKLICAYAQVPPDDIVDRIHAGGRIGSRDLGLVLAPTTSGSGAETTHFAVVYTGDDKHSIAGPAMLPDRIVLDPQLTRSGSPYQRATSGIDAVCQAIESLWATGATDDSRRYARAALPLLLGAIEPFVTAGDPEAARQMALGSHLAGRAIDVSKTTAAHALSYGITKGYGRSHGHAVATTLGAFIARAADAGPADLQPGVDPAEHAEVMAEVVAALDARDGADAQARFRELLERLGLEPRLSAAGADDEAARRRLADSVNVERLGNDPVVHSRDDLVAVLRAAG